MKPVFSNTFNVTHNKNQSEIALSFAHIYNEHNFSTKNGSLTDVSAQVADEVASVLITRDGTIALTRLLNRIIADWGVDLDSLN
ncbi:MAG: hypothetical protein AB7C97_03980 [Oscillospiraceae bacterium]